ncbi:11322_t:CDS:2, partial [Paraglomus occultum]
GIPVNSSLFKWSSVYAGSVFFVWFLGYMTKVWRNGTKSRKLDWDDEIVLITGGARGIGLLLAETLSIRNVTIVVLDIRKPEIDHPNIVFFECDVSKYDQVQRIAKEIIAEVGHPTIIVNNAGVVKGKTILDESEEEILSTISVNLLAPFWITKTFLPEMITRNHGHIVNISSALGFAAVAQTADYCATKSGIVAFHEALRHEINTRYNAGNIRCTLVCPGHVETGMFDGVSYKYPFITPTIAPIEVVKKIVTALDKNETSDILTPYYVHLLPMLRALPGFMHDWVYT